MTTDTNIDNTVSVSGVATFQSYDPKAPTAAKFGGRVVKCLYKAKKVDGEMVASEHSNSCLEIPFIKTEEVQENLETLMPHLVGFLETTQDAMVKAKHMEGVTEVEESSFSVADIVTYLEATTTSGKLSKEVAEQWFDDEVADTLTVLFADKLGISDEPTEEDAAKIAQVCSVYKKKLAALVGPKTFYMPEESEKLVKAIKLAEADTTTIGSRFVNRLERMQKEAQEHNSLLDL
jgi:hypothetical protein